MNDPLVSIIIPMYNSREWIEKLLLSISLQSYKNIEVILVNDGSVDNSEYEIGKFAAKNRQLNMKVVHQSNQGVSSARNNGVLHSNGELIAFVDSDDVWHPSKIEGQVRMLQDKGVEAIACSYVIFRDSNFRIIQRVDPDWSLEGIHKWLMLRNYGGLLSSTLLISRNAFEKTGPFDIQLSLSADIEFALRLTELFPVASLEIPLVG